MAGIFENDKCVMISIKPMRVVWLCNFSNAEVRHYLRFSLGTLDFLLRKLTKSNASIRESDYGQWISNAIEEFKRFDNIELHVVSPHYGLKQSIQDFCISKIHYHFYSDESFSFVWKALSKCGLKRKPLYKRNYRRISCIVDRINPDLIQLIGAENINYSIPALSYNPTVPFIVQLQTLVNDPKVYHSLSSDVRDYIRSTETAILSRADFIFTSVPSFMSIIRNELGLDSIILSNKLAVGVLVDKSVVNKEFDFVYFSVNINKAADIAIKSFAIAKRTYPDIKLDIVGYYSPDYKHYLDEIIVENEVCDSVFFEGHLPTHDDVIRQIKKSKFALLPLRPDVLPSTIREAMSVGCPVITTTTEMTPELNKNRLSVLLCDAESPESHALNMCRLLGDKKLSEQLRENSFITVEELYNNRDSMRRMMESYYACYDSYYYNRQIPEEFFS